MAVSLSPWNYRGIHYFRFCLDDHALLVGTSMLATHTMARLQVRQWNTFEAGPSLVSLQLGIIRSASHLTDLLGVSLIDLHVGPSPTYQI